MAETGILHAEAKQLNGAAAKGSLQITVDTTDGQVRDPIGNVVFSGPLQVALVDGEATLTLPASDDATLSPTGFTYTVVEQLDHVAKANYRTTTFPVAADTTVELADMATGGEVAEDPDYGASLNGLQAQIDAILAGGSGSGAGATRPGVYVPEGSLDRWKAVRDDPEAFGEVVAFGDSTTSGEGALGSAVSWVYKLRDLAIEAGVEDGGRGLFGGDDTADRSGEGLSGIFARTGFATNGGSYDFYREGTFRSVAANDTITFQGYGTKCRLHYSFTPAVGDFTYKIDGGSEVTVHAYDGASSSAIKPLLLDLGADGLHQVTIKNLGGRDLPGPTIQIDQGNTTGAIPAGAYYWRATIVTTSGETLPGPAIGPITMDGTHGRIFFMGGMQDYEEIKLYRSTDPNTGFQLVTTADAVFNMQITDAAAAGGAAAPTTSTAGLVGPLDTRVSPEFFRDAGVVFHKQGISGSVMSSYWGVPAPDATNNGWGGVIGLGITSGYPPAYGDTQTPAGNAEGAHPLYRNAVLGILALGINDQQSITNEADLVLSISHIIDGVGEFKRVCDSAGADALVIVPHYEYASGRQKYAMRMRQAHWSAAVAMGCAVLDFNVALGARNTGRIEFAEGPHLNQDGYDLEAEFVWENALGV